MTPLRLERKVCLGGAAAAHVDRAAGLARSDKARRHRERQSVTAWRDVTEAIAAVAAGGRRDAVAPADDHAADARLARCPAPVAVAVVEDHALITPCACTAKFACAELPLATLTTRLV